MTQFNPERDTVLYGRMPIEIRARYCLEMEHALTRFDLLEVFYAD